jgi:hypothetical protein
MYIKTEQQVLDKVVVKKSPTDHEHTFQMSETPKIFKCADSAIRRSIFVFLAL